MTERLAKKQDRRVINRSKLKNSTYNAIYCGARPLIKCGSKGGVTLSPQQVAWQC